MTRRAPLAGLLAISFLLPLMGVLLVAHAVFDSVVLWVLFVVVAFAVVVVGVVTAAHGVRAADAARLDEMEPLPAADAEGDRP